MVVGEGCDLVIGAPFLRGERTDLHQTDLAHCADRVGFETAFLPDDGFDQSGIYVILTGGIEDLWIETGFISPVPPYKANDHINDQKQSDEGEQLLFLCQRFAAFASHFYCGEK